MKVIMLGTAAAILLVAKTMMDEAVRKEYHRWAPALARTIVRLAGLVCPQRRTEWLNDILVVQSLSDQNESGLWAACEHLLEAPKTFVRQHLTRWRNDPVPTVAMHVNEGYILIVPRDDVINGRKKLNRVHPAMCCRPSFPREIVGYRTSEGYISLHSPTCLTFRRIPEAKREERGIDAEWLEHLSGGPLHVVVWARFPEDADERAFPIVLQTEGWDLKRMTSCEPVEGTKRVRFELRAMDNRPSYLRAFKALRLAGGFGFRIEGTPGWPTGRAVYMRKIHANLPDGYRP